MSRYSRHPNAPALSTLLISHPPTIVIDSDNAESDTDRSKRLSSYHASPNLPSSLSPIDSISFSSSLPSTNLLSVNQSSSLPPLQGNDPPKRLKRHPSNLSMSSVSSDCSPSSLSTKPTLWHVASSSTSPMLSPLSTCFPLLSPPPSFSLLSPNRTGSSPPNQDWTPPSESLSSPAPRSPLFISSPGSGVPQDHELPLPPSTQIILDEAGQPILKRRRGRPPSLREPTLEGGWTFLTPTVWDVNQQLQNRAVIEQHGNHSSVPTASFAINDGDATLQMPRKKRGRKPKTHVVGNSCFVWKDVSAAKRPSKKDMSLPQQQQDQHSITEAKAKTKLRRIEQAPARNN